MKKSKLFGEELSDNFFQTTGHKCSDCGNTSNSLIEASDFRKTAQVVAQKNNLPLQEARKIVSQYYGR